MAIKKIPCGGWLYDDEQITFEDGVMKVIDGGISEAPIDGKQYARKDAEWSEVQSSGGGGMVVHFSVEASGEQLVVSADKTPAEVMSAALTGSVVGTLISPVMGISEITPIGSMFMRAADGGVAPAFFIEGIDPNSHTLMFMFFTDGDNWLLDTRT